MKKLMILGLSLALILVFAGMSGAQSIVTSKHNLSSSGTGDYTSTDEDEICVFCHTPHHAIPEVPLWNRNSPAGPYGVYGDSTSATLDATIDRPHGVSLMCLSCHDGTLGLNALINNPAGGVPTFPAAYDTLLPASNAYLGTNLTNDHPVSFTYDDALATTDGELNDPDLLTYAQLFTVGTTTHQLECASCHDVHNNSNMPFLIDTNENSRLCLDCHDK